MKDRISSTPEQVEARVRAALDELGITGWEWIEIDPQYGDTTDFRQQYGYDLPHCANTIIVASKRGPAAFCAGIDGYTGWHSRWPHGNCWTR